MSFSISSTHNPEARRRDSEARVTSVAPASRPVRSPALVRSYVFVARGIAVSRVPLTEHLSGLRQRELVSRPVSFLGLCGRGERTTLSLMKAAPFEYVRVESVDEALNLLSLHGGDAKLIAGGQSLVPMMAMRLARPAVLVDIARLNELKESLVDGRFVTLGAGVRQRHVELDVTLYESLPLVRDALRWVGHIQTRTRGTVGGSLVHADPSAELPLAAVVLGATFRVRSLEEGERRIAASEFFLGPMFNALGEQECLIDIEWPVWNGPGVRTAFEEVAMRHGDFAMASAACQLQLDGDGVCRRAAFGLGGVDGTPLSFPDISAGLEGYKVNQDIAREIAQACVARIQPASDVHADADYRRHLAGVLLTRVILQSAGLLHAEH